MIKKKITVNLIPPVGTLLFLVFFLAKIFDKIDWSWIWVFSPLWIPLSIICGIMLVIFTIYAVIFLIILIFELCKKY